ncbi:hypothetical protein ACJD0Z_06715 [Flavobacteriaceae bacterium M23B6Z8]
MKEITKDFEDKVLKISNSLAYIQIIVTIIAIGLIIFLNEMLSNNLGKFAFILTILSVPSMSWWARYRINHYKRNGWKSKFSKLDFSGEWKVTCEFLQVFNAKEVDFLPQPNSGRIKISQSPFSISLEYCELIGSSKTEVLEGWDWLSSDISENGKYIETIYRMHDLPNPKMKEKRSHGVGYEKIKVVEWGDVQGKNKPTKMISHWYDCVRDDKTEPLYIGKNTFVRV